MQQQHTVFYSPDHGAVSNGMGMYTTTMPRFPSNHNNTNHTYYSNSNSSGHVPQPMPMMMMHPPTHVPMNSTGNGAQWVVVQQQQQQMPVAYNGLGLGLGAVASMTDEDERKLKNVAKDVVDQLREATQRVLKSIQRGNIDKTTSVRLLRKLGVTAEEPVEFGKPRNARDALALVRSFVSLVSSKLVPDLQKENQKHVVYVLTIVRAYISSMYAFVRKEAADDDFESDEDEDEGALAASSASSASAASSTSTASSTKGPQLAVTHTLSRLQHARNTIPEKLKSGDEESLKQITLVLDEIYAILGTKKTAAGIVA